MREKDGQRLARAPATGDVSAFLLDETAAVGEEQVVQIGNLHAQFGTDVGVVDHGALTGHLDDLRGTLDVRPVADGLFRGGEGFMLHQLESAAVVDEGVAGDASRVVVCFGETAVDDHQPPVGLDGVFALAHAR